MVARGSDTLGGDLGPMIAVIVCPALLSTRLMSRSRPHA